MPSPAPGAPHLGGPDDKMRARPDHLRAFAERLDADGDVETARHVRVAADERLSTRARDAPSVGPVQLR